MVVWKFKFCLSLVSSRIASVNYKLPWLAYSSVPCRFLSLSFLLLLFFLFSSFSFLYHETRSLVQGGLRTLYVAKDNLKLLVLLPAIPKCWPGFCCGAGDKAQGLPPARQSLCQLRMPSSCPRNCVKAKQVQEDT